MAEDLTISALLTASKLYLAEQLNVLKTHLLDFRAPTITQFMSLCERVNSHFGTQVQTLS